MNYRHSFHAGNHADVLKHIVLIELLRLLTRKPAPLAYLDSHAGAGLYALDRGDAERTGEWRSGIGRLHGLADTNGPDAVRRYLAAVRAVDPGGDGARRYPGSPLLAAHVLREHDRLRLCESQADIVDELTALTRADRRIQIVHGDGYRHALKAMLPPAERRALVLVDPPYEAQQAEYDLIITALSEALTRFATGVYAIWYPIKRSTGNTRFLRRLARLPAKSALTVELWPRACDSPLRLNGSGVAILNPPWPFDDDAATWLPWLGERLAAGRGHGWRCRWLRRENQAPA